LVLATEIAALNGCNPFAPDRLRREQQVLGEHYDAKAPPWNVEPLKKQRDPNVQALLAWGEQLIQTAQPAYLAGKGGVKARSLYHEVASFVLFHRHQYELDAWIVAAHANGKSVARPACYRPFVQDVEALFGAEPPLPAPTLFAVCAQVRRAFYHIFRFFAGRTAAAMALRAAIWESIFTHAPDRVFRGLHAQLTTIPTLITGPSGSGKEVVARAIGLSRYIPYDPAQGGFAADFVQVWFPLNLSALTSTLIESELFGHRRGAFTGALQDREGYFSASGDYGAVFLDEIGEASLEIQVKLLRVMQTRQFQALGDTQMRQFGGKIIAATNRDLAQAMAEGAFREDFYYRLGADVLTTPSLAELTEGRAGELRHLAEFAAKRLVGDAHADALLDDFAQWAKANPDYAWPGNFRELEQALRQILLRRDYRPLPRVEIVPETDSLTPEGAVAQLADAGWTLAELNHYYTREVYRRQGSYQATALALQVDHRTAKKHLASPAKAHEAV